MSNCDICNRREADRLLGIDPEMKFKDNDQRLLIQKRLVKYVCRGCADEIIESGEGREMPLDLGDTTDIWYRERMEITDGNASISTRKPTQADSWA